MRWNLGIVIEGFQTGLAVWLVTYGINRTYLFIKSLLSV